MIISRPTLSVALSVSGSREMYRINGTIVDANGDFVDLQNKVGNVVLTRIPPKSRPECAGMLIVQILRVGEMYPHIAISVAELEMIDAAIAALPDDGLHDAAMGGPHVVLREESPEIVAAYRSKRVQYAQYDEVYNEPSWDIWVDGRLVAKGIDLSAKIMGSADDANSLWPCAPCDDEFRPGFEFLDGEHGKYYYIALSPEQEHALHGVVAQRAV